MTDLRKAAEMALEALSKVMLTSDKGVACENAAKALRQALAQPEQEPVAFYIYKPTLPHGNLGNVADGNLSWVYDQDPSSGYSARMLVYTAPPKKEWVGLTDGEIYDYADKFLYSHGSNYGIRSFGKAIEARLKEKNGG